MVQKHVTQLHDDIDGTEAHKTVTFSFDGKHYEIDLSVDNFNMMHDALGRYIGKARLVSSGRGRVGRPARGRGTARVASVADKARLNAIREWARHNGYTVSDRGRIPAHIEAAYNASH